MHDPLVVAFDVRLPIPRKTDPTFIKIPGGKRWLFNGHYFQVGRHAWRLPVLLVVWHREPGGADSGTVCRHYRRGDGKVLNRWRFHIHHWRVQVPALQMARRRLLTRCAWCGGRSRKGDAVNVSPQWDGPRAPWWKGEQGLVHMDCSSVERAHAACLCDVPGPLTHGDYGTCAYCGKYRVWQNAVERMLPPRMSRVMLASLPKGSRIPASMRPELERLWAEERAELDAKVSDG